MTRLLALSLAALVALSGCASNDFMDQDFDAYFDDFAVPEVSNAQGRLAGELPYIGSFAEDEAQITVMETYGFQTYLELHRITDEGWGMIGVNVYDDELTDGVPFDISYQGQGCSGPELGVADFDEQATSLEVVRTTIAVPGGSVHRYTLRGEFANGGEVEGFIQAEATGH